MSQSEHSRASWRDGNFAFQCVRPFRFQAKTAAELRPYLGANVDAYMRAAAALVFIQRDEATAAHPTVAALRAQLRHAAAGKVPHPAVVYLIDAALLLTLHVQPADATPDQVRAAAEAALRDLPMPRRGRPRRPGVAGRDALEESLGAQFHALTGRHPGCADAAACAAIILRSAGIADTDSESRQRAARRRRTRT